MIFSLPNISKGIITCTLILHNYYKFLAKVKCMYFYEMQLIH